MILRVIVTSFQISRFLLKFTVFFLVFIVFINLPGFLVWFLISRSLNVSFTLRFYFTFNFYYAHIRHICLILKRILHFSPLRHWITRDHNISYFFCCLRVNTVEIRYFKYPCLEFPLSQTFSLVPSSF